MRSYRAPSRHRRSKDIIPLRFLCDDLISNSVRVSLKIHLSLSLSSFLVLAVLQGKDSDSSAAWTIAEILITAGLAIRSCDTWLYYADK